MKRKTKCRLLALLAAAVAGFGMLNVLAYNHASTMTHFSPGGRRTTRPEGLSLAAKLKVLLSGINVPRPAGDRPPSALGEDCRALYIDGWNGVTLSAWYCGRGAEAPLVILFHGYARQKDCLIPEAKALLDLGASVLLVDFRGS
ncbi:MAG: hypothetical protein WCK89_19385, partial [bacterium]